MAAQEPAVGEEPVDADRTARVQLVGADADLGAETVAVPVGKTCTRVVVDAGRVDLGDELLGGLDVGVTIASVCFEPFAAMWASAASIPATCLTAMMLAPNSNPKSPSAAALTAGARARVAASPRISTPALVSAAMQASSAAPAAASHSSVSVALQAAG